jgi:hypothetical protein
MWTTINYTGGESMTTKELTLTESTEYGLIEHHIKPIDPDVQDLEYDTFHRHIIVKKRSGQQFKLDVHTPEGNETVGRDSLSSINKVKCSLQETREHNDAAKSFNFVDWGLHERKAQYLANSSYGCSQEVTFNLIFR